MNKRIANTIFSFFFSFSLNAQSYSDRIINSDSNLIIKNTWGISLTKLSNWSVTSNGRNNITLVQKRGQSAGDQITIDYIVGDSIRDESGKFGWIVYWFDNHNHSWMKKIQEDENLSSGIVPKPADTLAVLTDGFPIFGGAHRWATVIIPLTNRTFLRCYIGSGSYESLCFIVGTIRKTQ